LKWYNWLCELLPSVCHPFATHYFFPHFNLICNIAMTPHIKWKYKWVNFFFYYLKDILSILINFNLKCFKFVIIRWHKVKLRVRLMILVNNYRKFYMNAKQRKKWSKIWKIPSGEWFVVVMVFNATFNNISVISWRSVLLVEETGENHRPAISHRQNTLKWRFYYILL
jgi:hypothetical protein